MCCAVLHCAVLCDVVQCGCCSDVPEGFLNTYTLSTVPTLCTTCAVTWICYACVTDLCLCGLCHCRDDRGRRDKDRDYKDKERDRDRDRDR